MNSVKNLFNALMDGIKDTRMLYDYADEAAAENKAEWAEWFRTHARKRAETLEPMYDAVCRMSGLAEKVKGGDEIAAALKCHLEGQIKEIKKST